MDAALTLTTSSGHFEGPRGAGGAGSVRQTLWGCGGESRFVQSPHYIAGPRQPPTARPSSPIHRRFRKVNSANFGSRSRIWIEPWRSTRGSSAWRWAPTPVTTCRTKEQHRRLQDCSEGNVVLLLFP